MKPGAQFWIQGRKFQKQGQNLCHQGRNIEVRGAILGPPGAGFSNYVSPGGWTCQVMHSGILIGFLSLKWRRNKWVKHHHQCITHVNKQTERSAQNIVPRFRLSVSEYSCWYYNILSDHVLFLTEISVFLSILLPKFIDWVLIMKWSNDLWLMSYGKYFDHEMVEWYHMENILTMRWSNDFIRHLPYNETWIKSEL